MKTGIDASSIIFLAKLSRLDPIKRLFGEVYTTPEIVKEVTSDALKHTEVSEVLKWIGKIRIKKPKKHVAAAASLDKGELSLLSLAFEEKFDCLISDDSKVIKAARSLGIRPISTIFLLVKAKKEGLLDKQAVINDIRLLSTFSYRISIDLYEEVLKLLDE